MPIYARSPAAYDALKRFNILQLPSKSTLQSYTGAFLHDAGACIEDQVAQFILFCDLLKKEGKFESKKDGVLIFDEVKVVGRLMWNSHSQTLVGLAMNAEEQCSLADVYQLFDDAVKQTLYILQFLWRDLTSKYDIVGPYFTWKASIFLLVCLKL